MRDTVLEQYLAKMGFLRDDYLSDYLHRDFHLTTPESSDFGEEKCRVLQQSLVLDILLHHSSVLNCYICCMLHTHKYRIHQTDEQKVLFSKAFSVLL